MTMTHCQKFTVKGKGCCLLLLSPLLLPAPARCLLLLLLTHTGCRSQLLAAAGFWLLAADCKQLLPDGSCLLATGCICWLMADAATGCCC